MQPHTTRSLQPWSEPGRNRRLAWLQVRDEYRTDYDNGRGGYGNIMRSELESRQQTMQDQMGMYAEGQDAEEL